MDEILGDLGDLVGADFQVPVLTLGPWFRRDAKISIETDSNGETSIDRDEVCVPFSDADLDGKWLTVRVLTILTLIVGVLATIVLALSMCTKSLFNATNWKYLAALFLVVLPLFQGLTFLLLSSNACTTNPLVDELALEGSASDVVWKVYLATVYEPECEWSHGSTANVIAVVCWFLTGISMICLGEPVH